MPRPRAERPKYTIVKRGANYYLQWWQDGRSQRISCRTSNQAEARRFLAEFQAGVETPERPLSPTIGAILDGYLSDREPRVHSPTIRYCCEALKRHLADLSVELLTKEQVRRYIQLRRKAGAQGASAPYRETKRSLSDGTLIRELGTLRAALAWAVRERWIEAAPHIERPSAPRSRERWLTKDEADRLLAAAKAPHIRLFIALALYTAARAAAILQLTWDQIDMEAGTIGLGEGRGKKRRATVPIVQELRPYLEEARRAATSPFVVELNGAQLASIKTGFRAAVARAGLTDCTPHVLRHTAATWMVQANVPMAMIARWLGNTEAMVEKVYGHHSPQWLKAAADAFSRPVA